MQVSLAYKGTVVFKLCLWHMEKVVFPFKWLKPYINICVKDF